MRNSHKTLVVLTVAMLTLLTAELGARGLAPVLPEVLHWDTEFTQVKARDIQRIGQVDVAFVGSSVVNAGYEASILVDAVDWIEGGYNSALPSTTPRSWEPWVRDLVIPDLCPGLMVIGVSAREYSDNTTGADNRRFNYFVSEGRRLLYGERPADETIEEFFESELAIVRVRSRLREPYQAYRYLRTGTAPNWPEPRFTDEGRYLNFDDEQVVVQPPGPRLRETMSEFETGGIEDESLRRIVQAAQSEGIEVMIVEWPTVRVILEEAIGPNGRSELDRVSQLLDRIGEDLGIPVIRYGDLYDQVEFFADAYHPNLAGSEEMSRRLAADINRLYPEGLERPSCSPRPDQSGVTSEMLEQVADGSGP